MPRFAANLSLLFTECAPLDRFKAARAAGFQGCELLFPYDHAAADLAQAAEAAALPVVLINTPGGNWAGGERGVAAIPGCEARFRDEFDQALAMAGALGAGLLHVLAGLAEGAAARATYVDNLRWAAARAAASNPALRLTIEPINGHDMPGYFLQDFAEAQASLAEIAAPNLGLQFDAYHAQRITGDARAAWDNLDKMPLHVQVAGVPGRHEPQSGDIDFPAFFTQLDTGGYAGWVSGEYHPKRSTTEGLGWLREASRS
ncbi:hydroxypyruvate isomerase family protein [Roseovarius nubinhibens]|uniref:Xylose isomerase-like TIM barrel domain-containing protein n=1 Tax=Roseovarius nubinhibens (strain ATCC BAA-591 / DSM 15170 / ISM) TaxID=89187 RepID=A3SM56_ROSNI|nr:TIM barrel protein [Roseovarius nubinhibens]EAP78437.1 hypothetical protein ISM_09070 [Roseovarius nubinhibens ISM]